MKIILVKFPIGGISVFHNHLKSSFPDIEFVELNFALFLKEFFKNKRDFFLLENQFCFLAPFRKKSLCFLHGWVGNNKPFKKIIWQILSHFLNKSRTQIFTCSHISKSINQHVFGIKNIKSVHHFIEDRRTVLNDEHIKEFDLVYVGRNSRVKKVGPILNLFENYSRDGFKCAVVGIEEPKNYDGNLSFFGVVPNNKVFKLLEKSKIFISFNELEPFGLTYIEASNSGCKVICPYHSGFAEISTKSIKLLKFQDVEKLNMELLLNSKEHNYLFKFNVSEWQKIFSDLQQKD